MLSSICDTKWKKKCFYTFLLGLTYCVTLISYSSYFHDTHLFLVP